MDTRSKHLENLYQISRIFLEMQVDLDIALKKSLAYLIDVLDFDRAAIFLYDKETGSLVIRQILEKRGVIEGETRYSLSKDKEISVVKCFNKNKKCMLLPQPQNAICSTLSSKNGPLGILKVDNMASKRSITDKQMNEILDYAEEIAIGVWSVQLFAKEQEEVNKLMAFSELSRAIISTIRLEEILTTVMYGLIRHIGFDRAKLYLLDKREKILKGVFSFGLGRRLKPLKEKFPLKEGENRLVDLALGMEEEFIEKNIIIYKVLKVKGEPIGVVRADNIFTRQSILKKDIETLETFTNLASIAISNARLFEEVQKLSITDGLTQLYGYRYFTQCLSEEILRTERFGGDVSLILFDIDNFKNINDTYGHPFGDRILQEVAEAFRKAVREVDFPARYGGDEFVGVLIGTNSEAAKSPAYRIQEMVSSHPVHYRGTPVNITLSIGIASFPKDASSKGALIKRADEALYAAKRQGRSRICLWSELPK